MILSSTTIITRKDRRLGGMGTNPGSVLEKDAARANGSESWHELARELGWLQ